jgi:hypothetical protein
LVTNKNSQNNAGDLKLQHHAHEHSKGNLHRQMDKQRHNFSQLKNQKQKKNALPDLQMKSRLPR